MRCKTCQLLGHTAKRCNNAPSCQSCNFPPHPPPCSRIYCANCAGDHPSSSKSCPKYMQSKEILKIKCQNKCSMREALKLYKEQTPTTLNASFAAVVSESQNLSKIEQSKTKPPAALAPNPSSKSPSTASLNAHSDTLIQPNSTSSNTTTENNKNPQISNSQSSIDSLSIPSGTSFQINSDLSNLVSENNNDHVSKTMPSFIPNELNFNSHPQFSPHTPLLLDSTLSHILTQAQSIQTAYVPQSHTSQTSNSSAINQILSQTQFNANNIHDQTMSDNDQTMSHSDPQYMLSF